MAIDVFRHEVQEEFSVLIPQKLKYRFRPYVPSGRVDECKCETVLAGRSDAVQVILKRSME
jgi:hypothetical protein